MASDLLILYPEIANASTRFQPSNTFAGTANEQDFYPGINSTRGAKWQLWKSSSNSTAHFMNFDVGPLTTKTVNFVVASKLNILRALGTTIALEVRHSSDDSSYTVDSSDGDIDALTLYGPQSDDYVKLFSTTSAFRYWQVGFTAGASFANQVGKLYIGNSLDLGVNLDNYSIEYVLDSNPQFETSAGNIFLGKTDLPRMKLELTWYGVTDANVKSFFDNVYARRLSTPVFLYTQTYHDPLDAKRLLCCALESATSTNRDEKDDFNTLTTKWIEMVG